MSEMSDNSKQVILNQNPKRSKSKWLILLLVIFVLTNIGSICLYLIDGYGSMRQLYPSIPNYIYHYFFVHSILLIALIAGIFYSIRWCIPTFIIIYLSKTIVSLFLPIPFYQSIGGIVGIGVFIILVFPLWKDLKRERNNIIAP